MKSCVSKGKGQVITELTTTTEGNALIMRKGRTSLFSAKVMLFALLNVENRNEMKFSIKDTNYYKQLLKESKVDYSRGLVAEMDVSDLKKLLHKERSGSFYAGLRELFSIDPHEEKSLRNSWAVMLPNGDDVLGYAEVITACHYDVAHGKLFIKFSDEEFIKSQIWQIRSEYTELPFLHMISIKSIYTYRLYEIIYSEMVNADMKLREQGEVEMPTEYSFKFSLGELQLMMGIIDVTKDKEGKKKITSKAPDYNAIASDVNTRQLENMGEYRTFRRYSLQTAVKEINTTETSSFTISYDVEKDESTRKVTHVVFYVKRKTNEPEISNNLKQVHNDADFIVDLARELSAFSLTFDELQTIASISGFNKELVLSAQDLYNQLNIHENFVTWFKTLRK